MPIKSRDEVLRYAAAAHTLIRARKHLKNRGAEQACIRLLGNLIMQTERDFYKPSSSALLTCARTASTAERSRPEASPRHPTQQDASTNPWAVNE